MGVGRPSDEAWDIYLKSWASDAWHVHWQLGFRFFSGVAERVFLQLLYARKRHLPKLFRSLTEHVETNYRPALVFVPHCFAELVSLSEEQHGRGFNAVVRSTPILEIVAAYDVR